MIASATGPSSTLRERLFRPAAPGPGDAAHPADAGERRLAAWCGAVANADWASFRKRLEWDGLDAEHAARALLSPPPAEGAGGAWAEMLARAYGDTPEACAAAFAACAGDDRALRADAPLPFESLFLPLLAAARAEVRSRAGAACARVDDAAHAALERALLQRLTHVCGRALYAGFSVRRSMDQQVGLGALFAPAGGVPDPLFRAFVEGMRGGGIHRFFREHCVAARLCGTVALLWIDATAELLARLAEDAPALEAAFGGGAPLGTVAELTAGVSDPHQGGRTVLLVRWSSGARAVYKPRPLGLEAAFAELVEWINARADLPPLRAPGVVRREAHGWVEFVEHAPCDGPEAAARFYRRCGGLLAVAYAVGGSDFHYENLIAAGEHPVLIDLETLLSPRFELGEQLAAEELAGEASRRRVIESVLSTCMLPTLKVRDDGSAVDLGGFTGAGSGGAVVNVAGWAAPNTDAMRIRSVRVTPKGGSRNVPVVDGAPASPAEHVDDLVAGFRAVYRALVQGRGELLAPGGPLRRMAGERLRFVFRDTSLYSTLLERTLHPDCLRDGADRGMQLDVLSRTLLTLDARPAIWPIVAAEQEALERMDVPFFTVRVDSRDLELPTGVTIRDAFRESAWDELLRRLGALSEEDLRFQEGLVRGAFRAWSARGLRVETADRDPAALPAADEGRLWEMALERARAVAGEIAARALRTPGGEASWVATGYLSRQRRYRTGPAAAGLLDGYPGIALFLAAVERATGGAGLEGLALAALAPIRGRLPEVERLVRLRRASQVGGGTGLASAAHALAHVSAFLGRPELLDDAARVAALLTPETVAGSGAADVVSGAAGVVLVLLALHARTGDPAFLRQAEGIGARMLEARAVDGATGLRVWAAPGREPETGFAHGQAGIALALRRLAAAAGDARFDEAADEAVRWERGVLASAAAAGADEEEARAAWSHGATGIALALLGAGAPGAGDRAEAEAALDRSRRHRFAGVDTLCCGSAARVDLLLAAASALGRPELAGEAREAAARIAAAAAARGGYRTGWEGDPQQLGLFQGEAGAAYQALRAARPELFPSLLLWE